MTRADRMTPTRRLAEAMLGDYREGRCSCAVDARRCGWHALQEAFPPDARRRDRAETAYRVASGIINPDHDDDEASGYLAVRSRRFATWAGR